MVEGFHGIYVFEELHAVVDLQEDMMFFGSLKGWNGHGGRKKNENRSPPKKTARKNAVTWPRVKFRHTPHPTREKNKPARTFFVLIFFCFMCDYLEPSLPHAFLYRDIIPYAQDQQPELQETETGKCGKQRFVFPRYGSRAFRLRGLISMFNNLRASVSKNLQFSINEYIGTAIGRSLQSYPYPSWSVICPGGEAELDEPREPYREYIWYRNHSPTEEAPMFVCHVV